MGAQPRPKKLGSLAASGHQLGTLEEKTGSVMLGDELVLGLEQALAVTYSVITSEFIDPDLVFLSKHNPPH